jgi:uncharacterized RDD family membrane protein YckC
MPCTNHPDVVEGVYACARCGRTYCNDCLVTIQGRRYCAQCKGEQISDIRSGVDTHTLPLAGLGRRFAAVWIDGFVIGLPVMVVVIAMMIPALMNDSVEDMPWWVNWMGWAFIPVYIAYEALMLTRRGQTVGKIALGIKVVRPDGQPISKGQAWGRSAVRSLFVSFLAFANYLPAFFTREKTCLHDMIARTRVVLVR